MSKSNLAIIGPKDLFHGLSSLGINVLFAQSESEADRYLNNEEILKNNKVIFITEALASGLTAKINSLNETDYNVVLIPDHRGGLGLASERTSELFKNALGGEITK